MLSTNKATVAFLLALTLLSGAAAAATAAPSARLPLSK